MQLEVRLDGTKKPKDLRARAIAAIRAHIAQHGRRQYDAVRERPEFIDFIGSRSGEAGRRKFFRLVRAAEKMVVVSECDPTPFGDAPGQFALLDDIRALELYPEGSHSGVDRIALTSLMMQEIQDIFRIRRIAIETNDAKLLDLSIRRSASWRAERRDWFAAMLTMDRLRQYASGVGTIIYKNLTSTPEIKERILAEWEALTDAFNAQAPKDQRHG